MTNTEGSTAVEREDLAWDADPLHHEAPHTGAEAQGLSVYGFDSEQRTLVGLGPLKRGRRSRPGADLPEIDGTPQSQPPGPFIADDDELEMARVLRGSKRGPWAVVAPAVLVLAAVAMAVVRVFAPHAPAPSKAPVAAVVPRAEPKPALEVKVEPAPAATSTAELAVEPAADAGRASPAPDVERAAHGESAHVASSSNLAAVAASLPIAPPVVPVKLPELPPPPVVEIAGNADANVGTLNVTSSPPANVVLDGRPLGKAPRLVRVPAGTHTVVFLHPLYGRQSRSVVVKAGRTSSASADF